MESKNGKQYLPQTYEQFQQQKKKGDWVTLTLLL